MNNNDILRRLRFALDLNNGQAVEMVAAGHQDLSLGDLRSFLAKETEPEFAPCPDVVLAAFLDGLILDRRGPPAPGKAPPPRATGELTNNMVLKKIRIALQLQQNDMLKAVKVGGMEISPSELSALFRKPGHKHYKLCGDQLMRKFLAGLTQLERGDVGAGEPGEEG